MGCVIAIPEMGHEPERALAKSKYVESLARAGAETRWIELEDPCRAVQEALECGGLLLPGGGDMDPAFYGQIPIPACGEPNRLRDAGEPKLLEAFLQEERPVFGICRGAQVLNVCLGGDLYQDIAPFQFCEHSGHWEPAHPVVIQRGTLLAELMGPGERIVNSCHHQAVHRTAPGLAVCALSSDGFVEAVERPGPSFCLGVQWHPERLSGQDPAQQRLFDAFVAAVRR